MIDHFRTLLLNESAATLPGGYTARGIHIDPYFAKVVLPPDLDAVYKLFYPVTSLVSKLQQTHVYMSLLEACGLEEAMTALDNCMTYTASADSSLFSPRAISNGVPVGFTPISGTSVRAFNFDYQVEDLADVLTHTLTLAQVSNSTSIRIDEGGTSWLTPTALTFTSGVSQTVAVFNPAKPSNKAFDLVVRYPGTWTATSGKQWTLTTSVPASVSLQARWKELRSKLGAINTTLSKHTGSPDADSYDQLWAKHFNSHYQMAGLLVALIYRMNKLRE